MQLFKTTSTLDEGNLFSASAVKKPINPVFAKIREKMVCMRAPKSLLNAKVALQAYKAAKFSTKSEKKGMYALLGMYAVSSLAKLGLIFIAIPSFVNMDFGEIMHSGLNFGTVSIALQAFEFQVREMAKKPENLKLCLIVSDFDSRNK